MKQRFYKVLKKYITVLIVGVIYFIFVSFSGFAFPCPFYMLTGFLCPSCGITRMLIEASRGNFAEAYMYNKVLFLTLPILFLLLAIYEIRYIKTGNKKIGMAMSIFLYAEIALLFAFCIVRNIT